MWTVAGELGDLGLSFGLAGLEELDHARKTVSDVGAGDATRVEGPHGQLGARLADGLRRDMTDRLADGHQIVGGQRTAVAQLANADVALAAEHRADLQLEAGVGRGIEREQLLKHALVEQLVALVDDLPGLRVGHVDGQHPAEQQLVEALVLAQRHLDGLVGAAVELADDHFLGHVDQTAGQVARVGGTQSGVGQTLAGAVGGDEVLEYAQAFHEVGLDGVLDDLALRRSHETAHTGQLADLLEGAAGSGVGHHVDRVEAAEVLLHGVGHFFGGLGPQVGDPLAALAVGQSRRACRRPGCAGPCSS